MADNERLAHHHLRAADTDRDAATSALAEHYATGRLTAPEHNERVSSAWAARTYGDLASLFTDLPPPRAGTTVSNGRPAPRDAGAPKRAGRGWHKFGQLTANVATILPVLIVLGVVTIMVFKGPLPLLILAGWWWWSGGCRPRTSNTYR